MNDVREGFRLSGLTLLFGAVGLVILLIFVAMATFGFGLFAQTSAGFRGETSKRNQVEANGQFRIQAYDRFFDLCTSIQGNEAQIAALEDELRTKPPADRVAVIQTSLAAVHATRATSIAQYNNDARKDYTVGQFKANNLPPRLDLTTKETTCAL